MTKLKAVFWDSPELRDEKALIDFLKHRKGTLDYQHTVTRLLEYGRVVDTLKFVPIAEITAMLPELKLHFQTRRKWNRMIEVYGSPAGK